MDSSDCAKCHKKIEGGGNAVLALGNRYHSSCFVCPTCKLPFEKGFLDHRGQPYHEGCLPDETGNLSTSCSACGKEIIGEMVAAANKSFCPSCFKCQACDKLIEGSFDMFRDKCYHPHCVPKDALPECEICKSAVHDKSVVLEGKFYHR